MKYTRVGNKLMPIGKDGQPYDPDEQKINDISEEIELKKIRQGRQSKNAGYTEPGFNFGLNKHIKNKDDWKRAVKQKQSENPDFQSVG